MAEELDEQTQDETNYKELYEKQKEQSRKWERIAKANKEAAEKFESASKEAKTAEESVAELTKRLEAMEKAEARTKLAAEVSKAKGVPAELLVGNTQEEMEEFADRMVSHFKPEPAPQVSNAGKFADKCSSDENAELREFASQLLGKD